MILSKSGYIGVKREKYMGHMAFGVFKLNAASTFSKLGHS